LAFGQAGFADTIMFDPDGTGSLTAVEVGSFDFLPGNSLAQSAGTSMQGPVPYTQYAQGRLGSLLDASNNVINVPGLNDTFEITVTAEFGGVANQILPGIIALNLGSSATVNKITLWYDDMPDADALTGLGYGNGDPILEGFVVASNGVFQVINPTGVLYDQFGGDDYAGQLAVIGNGSLRLDSEVTSVDGDFFLSNILNFLVNTNSISPYSEVDPSMTFDEGAVTPTLGPINGLGEDIQLQTDATGSFVIPEPASAVLMVLGAGLMVRRRR
jgi:hypothetical protein